MSSALAGRFLTTGPPGKFLSFFRDETGPEAEAIAQPVSSQGCGSCLGTGFSSLLSVLSPSVQTLGAICP